MNLNATQGSPYQGLTQTRPYDFGTDAIERQRVSLGQAMMDADFEYGLQATKWQSFYDIRKTPTFFEIPGTDATLSNVVSDGASPYSNITVYYSNAISQPQVVGGAISIFGLSNPTKTADRAEGYYIITSNSASANTANYIAKGYVPSGNVQTNLTFSKRGGIYNNGTMNLQFSSLVTDGGSNIQVFTSNAHGILAGTPMTLITSNLTSTSGGTANGTYFVCNVSSSNTFNIVSNTLTFKSGTTSNVANVSLYVNPFGSTQHRPYDGGVLLSTLSPSHGSTVLRQSKKAFRYQSGKGILFSSGTLFAPNLDIASMNLYGLTTALTSNSNGLTGVTLAVSQPTLLGLNQNVVFSPSTTNCFVNANVSIISGPNVTFVYSNTFTNYLPTFVNQFVTTAAQYTPPASVPVQMANTVNFSVGSATIGSLGTYTISAINSAAILPYTSASSLPSTFPFNITLGNFGTYSVSSNNSGTALSISPSIAATVSQGTPVTYSNTSITTAPTSTLTVQMSNTAGFAGSGYTVNVGNLGSYSVSSNTTSSITLSTWPSTIPTGTLISNSSVTGNLTTAGTTLTLNSPTSNISSATPFNVSIGALGTFTVSSITSGTSMALSTYPGSPLPTGTPVTYTSSIPTTGPAYSNLVFSTYPYSIPSGTPISQPSFSASNTSIVSVSNPLNLQVASTNGFIIGETVTLNPVIAALGTLTVSSNTSPTLGLAYTGTAVSTSPVVINSTVSGPAVSITGTVPITANIAGNQIFSNGQVVASYLGLNLGNVTITGTQTVASNSQITMSYTGSFPPNGIPAGTAVTTLPPGSNIQIVTDLTHGIPTTGATVTVRNVGSSNINGTGYTITGVSDSHTVNVQSQSTITTTALNYGDQPRLIVTNWHGSSVRAGIFEDPNGMFWEYDGQTLYVVRRQSTFQCAGYVSTSPQSQVLTGTLSPTTGAITLSSNLTPSVGDSTAILANIGGHTVQTGMYTSIPSIGTVWVVGVPDYFQVQVGFLPITPNQVLASNTFNTTAAYTFSLPTTRFQDQLRVNDRFTIRGMTHQVTSIQGQGVLTFNPPYRGASVIDAAHAVKACKIKELRIPQSQFNRDTMDGKGPSGYKVDLSRMQMIGIQYTWYGAGFIDYMMRGPDGNWIYAHRIRNNNVNDEAYMRSGNLPVRYELTVENRAAVTALAAPVSNTLGASATDTITVSDPTTYFPSAGTLLIDGEFINYSNLAPYGFTGLTRSYPLTYVVNDAPRTFTGSANTSHYTGTSVNLVSCSATPTLTHWGSSFLTDGQFDVERGYYFNYSNVSVNLTNSGGAVSNACAFAIRLAPSVTNGLCGDIGQKELLNRAQLLLQRLEVTAPMNVQTLGFLNPTGIQFLSNNWVNVNTPANGTQPSFVQYYPGSLITGTPQPGERIFSTIVQGNNQNNLDLSALKEMSNSVIGGNQNFPDGPDTLVVYLQSLVPGAGGSNVVQVNLFWSEAQA